METVMKVSESGSVLRQKTISGLRLGVSGSSDRLPQPCSRLGSSFAGTRDSSSALISKNPYSKFCWKFHVRGLDNPSRASKSFRYLTKGVIEAKFPQPAL
jgi:hypothetical protein